ncbi:unnamed protein product [Adineta ricciae]|uniref:F-box domain-containing protein n=1 Tax=Adineta ricciae TaxID=249248 RepID=A0A814FJT5_ADIRI|nr:unnamed protein product [Adineta ricciae]
MKLEGISNDLFLCIWDHLTKTDVIYSFSNLNARIDCMLFKFCGLYKELDLRYCSLSIFRHFSHEIIMKDGWRLNLTTLKIGNPYRCPQMTILADEVTKFFMKNSFIRKDNQNNNSLTLLRMMKSLKKKNVESLFPQLNTLIVFQNITMDENCRDIFLYGIACGSSLRTLKWRTCSYQTHHSKSFFDWLFQCSISLQKYHFENTLGESGFELSYHHTLINNYQFHQSLLDLRINILNLSTVFVLLHYLPKLQWLDVHISDRIEAKNDLDEHLLTTMNYPIELHTVKLRSLDVRGRGCYVLENLLLKFLQSLEYLSISMYHRCENEPELNYNGYSLSVLCRKLIHLRSFHFAIEIQMFEKADEVIVHNFTKTFTTPFWLNGPFGCKRVDKNLIHSTNLMNIEFNTDLEENPRSENLSQKLATLWFGMHRLFLLFDKDQTLPSLFIPTLHCPSSQGKTLILSQRRGTMPENLVNHTQLTHFNALEFFYSIDTNSNNNLQELVSWLQILPNVICLEICLTEFKYWLTNYTNNPHLCSFFQRLQRLHIDCSSLINRQMNEEVYHLFLSYIIDKDRFPQLKCLRLRCCKDVGSSWENIDQWIGFILTHTDQHRLTCVRFDFIEKENETTEMNICNQIMSIVQPSSIIVVHQFVCDNHIALWIERIHRNSSLTK